MEGSPYSADNPSVVGAKLLIQMGSICENGAYDTTLCLRGDRCGTGRN